MSNQSTRPVYGLPAGLPEELNFNIPLAKLPTYTSPAALKTIDSGVRYPLPKVPANVPSVLNTLTVLLEKSVTYNFPEESKDIPVVNPPRPVSSVATNVPSPWYQFTLPSATATNTSPGVNVVTA